MGSNKDDVKPINLKTEKDITAEFQKVTTVLENQNGNKSKILELFAAEIQDYQNQNNLQLLDADWNKRLEALKILQGMVIGNTWTHELFIPNYLKLYNFINFQLKDLRSAVQKEACKLLTLSAEKMQKSFEVIAIKFISKDSLLSIINSGNKILCENAHSCVQSIIENCPSPVFMSQLLEESTSKSQQVRSRVSQYLVQILPELNQSQLDKYLMQLDSSISKGVQDANPEVRQNFRQVFGLYHQLYPQKAERIFASQDTTIKKLLQEEMNSSESIQTITQSQHNRLLQQKSMDSNIGNFLTTSNNSSNTQKLQQSASMGNDDSHFHFATSSSSSHQNSLTVSNLVGAPSRTLNKTPTAQQKVNNLLPNGQAGMSASTSNNALNKSRNGSNHLSQDRSIVNNLKQVSDQMTFQSSNKEKVTNGTNRISPIRGGGNRNDTVSPLKGNTSALANRLVAQPDSTKPPVSASISSQSTKNFSQGTSYASSNFVNAGFEQGNSGIDKVKKMQGSSLLQPNIVGNLRQNNHQSNQDSKAPSSSTSNNISKIQNDVTDADISSNSRKVNAYRSQDPKQNQINENLVQQQMQGSRINNSLNRPPTQGLQKKPVYQKRNSLTEENQNSQDSGMEYEQSKNQNKKPQSISQKVISQSQSGRMVPSQKNKFQNQIPKQKHQFRDENDDLGGHNELDDDDYEPYHINNEQDEDNEHQQFGGEGQENEEEEDEEDDQQNIYNNGDEDEHHSNSYLKNNKNIQFKNPQLVNQNAKQRRGNYSSSNIRGEYDDVDNQNLSDEDYHTKQKKNFKNNLPGRFDEDEDIIEKLAPKTYTNQLPQNQFNQQKPDGSKRIVKSAMNSLKNSDQKNPAISRQQQQQQQQINNNNNTYINKSSAVSPTGLLLSGNVSTKHNNFMAASNEVDDRYMKLNNPPQIDEEQANKYTNNFKSKLQKGMTKSSHTLQKGQPKVNEQNISQSQNQLPYNWRDDDLELLLDKINNNTNWSIRVSAFESLKEVISELSSQNNSTQQANKISNDIEKINPAIMKRIVVAHIDHLSDSHFKVVSACLDSLISFVSYDTSYVLPKLDSLIFKVLNNLIDTKDAVSSKANFLVNILSKIFPGEKLIEPIQKVLEQTNKNLLKICSLEVLMVTVKNAEEYYQAISNVRHTVQLMCMIIQENQSQKQMVLPCLGIILALRDHNQQGTLHSILSLTNQNQITALRNLSYEFAQDLEEDLRKYVQKENIKPIDKIAKSNVKQFQIDQNPPILANPVQGQQQMPQIVQSSTPNSIQMSLTQNGGMYTSKQQQIQPSLSKSQPQNPGINIQNISQLQNQQGLNQIQKNKVTSTTATTSTTGKTSNSSPEKNQMQNFDIKRIEEIYVCVCDFEQNESFIIQYVNDILLQTIEFFKSNNRRTKDLALKILQSLFMRNYFYLTIQPHTVIECLSIYPHIPKDMDFYQVDEVIDEMVDCVPHLIFMKALVEKLNTEKPPQLQIMIKKISYILRKARKEEIRPFLDHIIDSFKITINDQSPDVRKSVVFCLVDLKFLFKEEVEPYLHQFTGNQQKLVDIYIKKRVTNDGNGGQD